VNILHTIHEDGAQKWRLNTLLANISTDSACQAL